MSGYGLEFMNEVYKILKVSKYQKEIYLQSFIDVKALIFLEYNNI